ncbi:MAG TPA: KilA-N domain-containing protein [Candidatus Sericytochromatia bacterium]
MAKRIEKLKHIVNAIEIEQRSTDGFINGTAMCVAHGKDLSNWLRTDDTLELAMVVAQDLGIEPNPVKKRDSVFTRVSALYPTLVIVKRGSPETGGGTWLHPDLAIQLAQWCSKQFGLQVSRWVKEWMTSGVNPSQLEVDKDRINIRDEVKDVRRKALTNQVKSFLQKAGQYNPSSKETGIFFGRVHNEVNLVITGEKAIEMRARLEGYLGFKVNDQDLLRDYFPSINLIDYAALCQAAANNMESGMEPINAVRLAAKQVLPSNYVPKTIDFTEKIALVRQRVSRALSQSNNSSLV